jgi:K+-sensing histidine kinase KdpD
MKRVTVRLGDPTFDLIPLIAHDLRTPITAIKGLSQLALRRPNLPAPTAQYLTAVIDEANNIAAIVDDLVVARRLEHGETKLMRRKVDLWALLRELVEAPAVLDGTPPRPVVVSVSKPVVADCDPSVLLRAVRQLVKVASQHVRASESVSIGVHEMHDRAEISIAPLSNLTTAPPLNGGPRLDPGDLAEYHDFEGFAVPNLSIYLAAKLIEVQGGQVWCDESPTVGAGFHVVLPGARG